MVTITVSPASTPWCFRQAAGIVIRPWLSTEQGICCISPIISQTDGCCKNHLKKQKPPARMAATQETAIFLFFSRTDLPYRNDLSEMDGKQEHVHLLVQYPPKLPVSALVNSLKGLRCGQNVVKTKWCVSATVRPEKLSRLPIPKRPQAMLTKNDF